MDKLGERLNQFCIIVLKLFYIQLLWLLFTILGLVVLGIGPATYAMFAVMRQWIRGKNDISIFPSFLENYKSSFKESAAIGIIYLVVGTILYVDLLYVQSQALRGLVIVISVVYLISTCYIFPIMVHYDWKSVKLKLKCSILFGVSYLQYTLVLFVALAVVYFILLMYPGLIAFFGISIGSYIIMWMTDQVFKRIEIQAGVMESNDSGRPLEGGGEA